MSAPPPTLNFERDLLRGPIRFLAAIDEVGRGALAGPVSVGVVLIGAEVSEAPTQVRDSKLLAPEVRVALVPRIHDWALGSGVGHASAGEIDQIGIIAALRVAGQRALSRLPRRADLVLLDGSHDWLTDPQQLGLFACEDRPQTPVRTHVKADLTCAAVAAASVLAKVERDAMMSELALDFPQYGWAENKGYASEKHRQVLAELGPCDQHRRSWRLPPMSSPVV